MTVDLRDYISKLKKSKEVKIIKKKVSTKFEIAGITAKADGTYALLFQNIKQNNFNLVSNLVGTRKRFALAVNSKENKIHESIFSSIKNAKKPKVINNGKFFENTSKNLGFRITVPRVLVLIQSTLVRSTLVRLYVGTNASPKPR